MCTYHNVQWKAAHWAKVLKLADDREHFLLPNFNEYHSMNQCGDLHMTHSPQIIHLYSSYSY